MDHILHISTHFSNLVKVSERVVVRHNAGTALVRILPRSLPITKRASWRTASR